MPERVQKRDGRVENFQLEKLERSLKNAAEDAGFDEAKINEVVENVVKFVMDSVADLESVDTQSLRTLILGRLDEWYPEVADAWRRYDREVKGRED